MVRLWLQLHAFGSETKSRDLLVPVERFLVEDSTRGPPQDRLNLAPPLVQPPRLNILSHIY